MAGDAIPSVREGELLADRYRIDALIGEGGHGRVYRATQIPLGREGAVEVLSATGAGAIVRTGHGRGDVDPVCTGAVASLLQRR